MTPAQRARMQAADFGPVELLWVDHPLWYSPGQPGANPWSEEFANNAEALERACQLLKTDNFLQPWICAQYLDRSVAVFTTDELHNECNRRLTG